jgi:hypothetical protein
MATVIRLPAPPFPRLREMVGGNGRGVITSWIPSGARAKFRVRVRNLRRIPRVEWSIKQFRFLTSGISEFKWSWDKKEYRVAGFDFQGHFVMVIGYTHKQGVYDPHDWLNTAKRRKGEVERDERGTTDFEP